MLKIEEGIISARDSQHTIKSITDIKSIIPSLPEEGSPNEVYHHNRNFIKSSSEVFILRCILIYYRIIYYSNIMLMVVRNC